MRTYLIALMVWFSFQGISQQRDVETIIQRGNWQFDFVNFNRFDASGHTIGDSVVLSRVPQRLKFKKNRPVRFSADGVVEMPQNPTNSCGAVSTFEALYDLKWREFGKWKVQRTNGRTTLVFSHVILELIEEERRQFTFLIRELLEPTE